MMTPASAIERSVLALGALAIVFGVLGAYGLRVALVGRSVNARLDSERGSVLLGRYPIEAFHWAARALGHQLARLEISPDAITWASLLLTSFSIPAIAAGHFEAAGVILLLGAGCDALDGIVARELGVASDSGEVLDAVMDRYADAAPLLGLAFFYRDSWLGLTVVLGALIGSMMVSYVRAKSEAMDLSLPGGLMRRAERLAYLVAALMFGPTLSSFLGLASVKQPVTLGVVALIALVSNYAAIRLTQGARAELRAIGRGPKARKGAPE
jgi:CDP-diacylglycerol--glycerol-3-phosphate 3-phosphatidyltransferase